MAQALPPTALQEMAFLAGHWRGERDGVTIEEMWLAPAAGVAEGMVRLIRDGVVGTIELLVATAERDRVVLRYNHFHPDYTTWESDGPIALTLTEAGERRLIFTNLATPVRHAAEMGYEATSRGDMTSWVIAVDDRGARTRHSFDFRRVA